MYPRDVLLACRAELAALTTMATYPNARLCYSDDCYQFYLWHLLTSADEAQLTQLLTAVGTPGYPVGMIRLPLIEEGRNARDEAGAGAGAGASP